MASSLSPSSSVSPSPSPQFVPAQTDITAIQIQDSITISKTTPTEIVVVD